MTVMSEGLFFVIQFPFVDCMDKGMNGMFDTLTMFSSYESVFILSSFVLMH